MKQVIEELTGYFLKVQEFDKDSAQDGQALHAYLIELTNIMARANFLMAEYQRKFRQEKKAAYEQLAFSSKANDKYYSPSLAKDFIDAKCSESGYVYDLAERTSRLCSHVIDAVRTIISSLKQEKIFSQYQ
jgi:phytoene dehydrogenase-like protein